MNKPQLFLLHFAGGNSYSFDFIKPYLQDFEVIQLELPGRGRRLKESLIFDFYEAADDMYSQIISKLTNSQLFIYGHSMGAYLALRVVCMLENAGIKVSYLIVSGNPGPGIEPSVKRAKLEPEEFRAELKKIGGIPDEVLLNSDLMNFYEPILRADFQISEESDLSGILPVDTPLYALMGSEEEGIEDINNWAKFTNVDFRYKILKGNHFFIHQCVMEVVYIFRRCKEFWPPYSRISKPFSQVK